LWSSLRPILYLDSGDPGETGKEKEYFLKYEEDGSKVYAQLFPIMKQFAASAEDRNKKELLKACQDFLVHLLTWAHISEDMSALVGQFVGILPQESS
jgi:hypothetical protein